MRVTDLARKLGLKTEELRSQLPKFDVDAAAKDVDAEKAKEIRAALAGKVVNEKIEEEPEQELMGMGMFFEEEEGEEDEAEEEIEEPEDEDEEEIDEDDEEERFVDPENLPQKKAKPTASIQEFFAPKKVEKSEDSTEKNRREKEREEAKNRWARAKTASQKLLKRKVKRMEKEKVRAASRQEDKIREAMASTTVSKAQHDEVKIGDTVSIRELAEKMGVSPIRIVGELLKNGVMSNLNASIDYDTATIVAEAFGTKILRDTTAVSGKEILKGNIEALLADEAKNIAPRPPIVAVMGHVDHGKTTLLDAIRKTDVVAGEAGGITQHIGAYQTSVNDRKITFLDTPGHEAFTTMRARGARATDIAILVVAAEEGVKPQTIEAINHARAAEIPIVVAITKIDKPGANIDKVKGELAEQELQAADWGGSTEMMGVSAPTGQGVEELLELVLLTHDMNPAQANPNRDAVGTVVESHLDRSLGPVATVLVNTGTLKVGDDFVIGPVVGRVKKMFDHNHKAIKTAEPGKPVLLAGLDSLPESGVGEILQAVPDAATARQRARELQQILDARKREKQGGMSQIISRLASGQMKELKLVVKADVEGSLEAIRENVEKIGNDEVTAKMIHGGVGQVSETDVMMAAAADALLVAFHTRVSPAAAKLAEREGVSIRQHTIIYKLLEEVEKLLGGMLDPEDIETELGELEVRGVFFTKGNEQIVGGKVTTGVMRRGANLRIVRDGKMIFETKISSLKREKEDVHEVKEGYECGMKLGGLKDTKIQEGDILQAWIVERKERGLG